MNKLKYLLIIATVGLLGAGCNTAENTDQAGNSAAAVEDNQNLNKEEGTVDDTETLKEIDIENALEYVADKVPTVKEIRVYNEDTDPNNHLGKKGYYTAAGAFWDTRTEYSEEYAEEKGMWATDAGGSIEIYETIEDAQNRIEYMESFMGNPLTEPGAFKQVDNVVLRVSSEYPKSKQDEMLTLLEESLQ